MAQVKGECHLTRIGFSELRDLSTRKIESIDSESIQTKIDDSQAIEGYPA